MLRTPHKIKNHIDAYLMSTVVSLPIFGFGFGVMTLYDEIGLLLPDVGDESGLSLLC